MKQKLLILFIGLCSVALQAQQHEVVANGGDYFQNTNGSIRWTVGEVITETFSNSAGGLSQGFHQTTITITEIPEPVTVEYKIIAFPNPAQDHITIILEKATGFEYRLFDINGKLIMQGKEKQATCDISVNNLKTGIYFLKIFENDKLVKTFKIEKI